MKKLKTWSLLTLFSVTIALGLAACGNNNPDNPNNPDNFSLVGTWKYQNSGTTETGVQTTSETYVFNQDGTFSVTSIDDFKGRTDDPYANDWHSESVLEGTYTQTDKGFDVTVISVKIYDEEQGKLVDSPNAPSDEVLSFQFDVVGNAIVMQSQLGGWLFYTKDGAKPAFGYANHELVGTWKYEEVDTEWDSEKAYIHEEIYTFNADGSLEYINYQYRDPDTKEIVNGGQRTGYWAIINNSLSDGMELTGNSKPITTIDMTEAWWNTATKAYVNYGIRNGGHPMQYELKDGKLYIGHLGMDEEYFYQYPLVKL